MNDREQMAWDMYFGSIVSFRMHPKAVADAGYPERYELNQMADLVDLMIEVRRAHKEG